MNVVILTVTLCLLTLHCQCLYNVLVASLVTSSETFWLSGDMFAGLLRF